MSLDRIVYVIVLFIVGFVWFQIVSLLRFPHLRVFVYALEPKPAILRIWVFIQGILLYVFGWVCMFLIIMYVLWLFIKKVVPNFPIPFKMILLKIPPFPQLERAGIFAFLDGIRRALFSKGKFHQRMTRLGKTFADFISRNTFMILDALGMGHLTKYVNIEEGNGGKFHQGKANLPLTREEKMARNRNRPDKAFEAGDVRKADDELQQCIEENTAPVPEEVSRVERDILIQKNSMARIICKARGIQSWARTFAGKG